MRLRVRASNLVEWLALRSGVAPLPIGDVWLAVFQARAIMAATRLGVFEALRNGPLDAAHVAAATPLRPDMAEMLLRLLACTPYVRRSRRGDFELRRAARRCLLRDGASSLVSMMELMYFNLEWFGQLETVLCSGRGVDMHARLQGEPDWRIYQSAMCEAARLQASRVARRVPLPRRTLRVLDIGGSHGLFGAAICRRRPGSRCEVLELPSALASARSLAAEQGLGEVVTHRAGDARRSDLGSGWDVVFAGNLLHHFQPDENREVLRRARRASREDASIAVWDLELPERRRRPDLVGDGMSLLFRVTSGAGSYTASEIAGWMREAGYDRIRVRRFLSAPGQMLLTGRVVRQTHGSDGS